MPHLLHQRRGGHSLPQELQDSIPSQVHQGVADDKPQYPELSHLQDPLEGQPSAAMRFEARLRHVVS